MYKKIISILVVILFLGINLSFAQTCTTCNDATQKCVAGSCVAKTQTEMNNDNCGGRVYDVTAQTCRLTTGDTTPSTSPTEVMGITCNQDQMINGQCKLNIYNTLGIRKSVGGDTSVGLFVQDIVLSATFFIGTLVTVALVVSGLMFIFAASSGKDPANAKKGMIGSLVGLLIVVSSYVIIRLVQYIAKGF